LPPLSYESLFAPFYAAMKPASAWRVGIEAEKFGIRTDTGAPVPYAGPGGILTVFQALERDHGWIPESEHQGGPIIALERAGASITLEPGAQLELSGRPCDNLHEVIAEKLEHLGEIARLCLGLDTSWLGIGFHPFARQEDLPWVPKLRYAIMREYLPTRGPRALDMMRRTATVQANFDYGSEEDAMRKMRAALRLSAIVVAMFANSPIVEGKKAGERSARAKVWLGVDPNRQGLLPALWSARASLRDYVEWVLDVPMFLFKREGKVIANTGQTFRSFLRDGYHGHRATSADWEAHLRTVFPEVRLKQTIEVRGADAAPVRYAAALPALWTGILYDERALAEAERLTESFTHEEVEGRRSQIAERALGATLHGKPIATYAQELIEIAKGGLARRRRLAAHGVDETVYLAPLARLVEHGRCPADELLEALPDDPQALRREIVERTRLGPGDGAVFGIASY
jgi:glutamate--cysteine ligase